MPAGMDEWMRDGAKRERRWSRIFLVGGILVVLVVGGIFTYVSLNRVEAGDERVHAALHGAGLKNATLGGADTAGCAEGESSRHFTATNAASARVEGTVCCGLTGAGKGCTIRWGR